MFITQQFNLDTVMFGFARIVLVSWICVHLSCSDIIDLSSFTNKNKYFTGNVIETISPIGFIQCQERCYRHADCKSTNYHKDHLYCELNENKIADTSNLEGKDGYLYKEMGRSDFRDRMNDGKPCFETTCHDNRKCINLKQNTAVCIRDKCKRSDYIMVANITWCLKFHNTDQTFSNAKAICEGEGARLVIPNTEEKHRYIVDNYLATKYIGTIGWWIGGTEITSGNWQYINGETINSATGWSKVHENNDGTCLVIWKLKLCDSACHMLYSFICEEVV